MMASEKRIRFTMSTPEHRIETIGGITYVDGILIANKTYSLPADYAPGGLLPECQAALDALMAGAAADGLSIYPISTYRSYDYQAGLYERYAARDGYAEADRYSARPGHSEHQTGLAIDVNSLAYDFAYTPEGIWLAAHCAEYGFILRYPEGGEAATGYRYEPWHIRYLGVELAEKVTASGLTLEEYLGITSVYRD
ncbi:MAG: M15 family metallopeptidase [Clostridia bacterium]|nr:M15 family metallopeptidase [Clostridia bacterium]